MTVNEAAGPDDSRSQDVPLELLTEDEESWTAVPADASGDDRVSKWLSIDGDALCDLEAWR